MNTTNALINFLKLLKLQTFGTLNIGIMIGVFYYFNPLIFATIMGKVIIAALVGFYIYFLHHKAAYNLVAGLLYLPTGQFGENFKSMIHSCNMDPEKIKLRYSYTDTGIAMAVLDTICIDPLLWNGIEADPEAVKAVEAIGWYVLPSVPAHAKERIARFKQILTPAAQQFIFKHELGHIFYNYSTKKLILTSILSAVAVFAGISAAMSTSFLGYWAFGIGLVVGGLSDLVLSYASNLFFKLREEKKADLFAAQFSSAYELQAAADFFEQHQAIVDANCEPDNFIALLPQALLSGHPNGTSRAAYLRELSKV